MAKYDPMKISSTIKAYCRVSHQPWVCIQDLLCGSCEGELPDAKEIAGTDEYFEHWLSGGSFSETGHLNSVVQRLFNLSVVNRGYWAIVYHWPGPGHWGYPIYIRRNSRECRTWSYKGRGSLTWSLGYLTSSNGQRRGHRAIVYQGRQTRGKVWGAILLLPISGWDFCCLSMPCPHSAHHACVPLTPSHASLAPHECMWVFSIITWRLSRHDPLRIRFIISIHCVSD